VYALAVVLGIAFWPGEKEPEYQGKKLSEWLTVSTYDPRDASEAVNVIGTNALPFLLKWADFEYPRWKRRIQQMYVQHRGWPGSTFVVNRLAPIEATKRIRWARIGFAFLRDKAEAAAPVLIGRSQGLSVAKAALAINCLALIGTNALPPMLNILANTNEPIWKRIAVLDAMHDMTYLGSNALPAIAVLVRCASETNNVIWPEAYTALRNFASTEPSWISGTSVPAPVPSPELRRGAVRAAADLGTNEMALFIIIGSAGDDPDPGVQAEAVRGFEMRGWTNVVRGTNGPKPTRRFIVGPFPRPSPP
jgi:hypothetical protein